MVDSSDIWDRLARFAAGECSPAEEVEILAWAEANPVHREMLASARAAWEAAGAGQKLWNSEAAWGRVHERMSDLPFARPVPPSDRPRVGSLYADRAAQDGGSRSGKGDGLRIWAIAASLVAIVATGGLMVTLQNAQSLPPVAIQELITRKGERAEIRLVDGTRVVLGPESRLQIDAGYNEEGRDTRLMGEAYFEVAGDAERPFTVTAGSTITHVLGTEFDVRAYPADSSVQVVVADGRVSFRASSVPEDQAVTLQPGDLATLRGGSDSVDVQRVNPNLYLGWHEGRLAFVNAPLSRVVAQVERWYGTTVQIGDVALRSLPVTLSFRDQPIDEVVAGIAASHELRFVKVGQGYTLYPKDGVAAAAGP